MMCIFVCVCTEPTREFDINIIAIIVYICIIYIYIIYIIYIYYTHILYIHIILSNRLCVPPRHIVLALESFLRNRFNRIELRMQARASELRNKYDD